MVTHSEVVASWEDHERRIKKYGEHYITKVDSEEDHSFLTDKAMNDVIFQQRYMSMLDIAVMMDGSDIPSDKYIRYIDNQAKRYRDILEMLEDETLTPDQFRDLFYELLCIDRLTERKANQIKKQAERPGLVYHEDIARARRYIASKLINKDLKAMFERGVRYGAGKNDRDSAKPAGVGGRVKRKTKKWPC